MGLGGMRNAQMQPQRDPKHKMERGSGWGGTHTVGEVRGLPNEACVPSPTNYVKKGMHYHNMSLTLAAGGYSRGLSSRTASKLTGEGSTWEEWVWDELPTAALPPNEETPWCDGGPDEESVVYLPMP